MAISRVACLIGLGAGVLLTATAWAQTNSQRVVTVPWLKGAELGMGYDATSGSLTGNVCIVVEPLPERNVQGGDPGSWSLTKIATKEHLVERLFASVAGEAKFAALSSGSARASFAQTIEITQRDMTMLAQHALSTIEIGTKRGPSLEVLKSDSVLADPTQFRRSCGTHYVGVITWGGELIMALQASDRSEQGRSSFEANVRATFSAGKGSADFKKAIDRLKTHEYLRIAGRKAGGSGNTAYSIESFAEEISTFRQQVTADPKANVLSVTLFPYRGFAIATDKSETVDQASDKLAVYDIKYQRLADAIAQPGLYDIDASDLPTAQRELERLRGVRDQLRVAIERCVYPPEIQSQAIEECAALAEFKSPPADAVDQDTPRRFLSDCRRSEILVGDQEFKGQFKAIGGDGMFGSWANVQFQVAPLVLDDRILRLKITQRISEPNSSKKKSEEDTHELTKEVDIFRSSGCLVRVAPKAVTTAYIRFQNNETHSFNDFVDQATCWRTGGDPGPGGRGFRAKQYSTFWCKASFLPVRNVQLLNEELLQNGSVRTPKRFNGLSWLK